MNLDTMLDLLVPSLTQFYIPTYELQQKIKMLDPVPPNLGFVYVVSAPNGLVKIGTTGNILKRYGELRRGSPEPLSLDMFWLCQDAQNVELALHAILKTYRRHGEWFTFRSYDYKDWNYLLLVMIALQTSVRLPIALNHELCWRILYGHIPSDDPCWKAEGGADLRGREFLPKEFFMRIGGSEENGSVLIYGDYASDPETLNDYGLILRDSDNVA